jgi:hypothetical protein
VIGAAVFTKLTADTDGVASIVGTRVYPEVHPPGGFPQVVYTAAREQDLAVNATRQLKPYQLTLHATALTYAAARTLAKAIFQLIAEGRGIGDWSDDCHVSSCVLENETESELTDPNYQFVTYYTVDQVYRIWTALN